MAERVPEAGGRLEAVGSAVALEDGGVLRRPFDLGKYVLVLRMAVSASGRNLGLSAWRETRLTCDELVSLDVWLDALSTSFRLLPLTAAAALPLRRSRALELSFSLSDGASRASSYCFLGGICAHEALRGSYIQRKRSAGRVSRGTSQTVLGLEGVRDCMARLLFGFARPYVSEGLTAASPSEMPSGRRASRIRTHTLPHCHVSSLLQVL